MNSKKSGKISLSKLNALLILSAILIFHTVWHYQDIRLWFHSVTSAGEKYKSLQQISDDLNVVYEGRYKIQSVEDFTLNQDYLNTLLLEDKRILLPYSQTGENKLIQITFTDTNWVNDINSRSKEVVTREAVSMLYFLTKRVFMESVEVVHFNYKPNHGPFTLVGTDSIIIPIEEFEKELNKNKGESIEKALTKIILHYY